MLGFGVFLPIGLLIITALPLYLSETTTPICIIGSGIGGSSLGHFLRQYSTNIPFGPIRIFDRNGVVGGRMATVVIAGERFEAGASILHPKNFHAVNFTKLLNLTLNKPSSASFSLGIWDGKKFVFKTLGFKTKIPFVEKIISLANSISLLFRYGISLFRLNRLVDGTVSKFLKYYLESRPVFRTVDEMLKWSGLYNLTSRTLEEELSNMGVSRLLIEELVTVITRINYGQSVEISGLAGAVSLAGSGGGLWSVHGGNWQMAAGLINRSDITLHLDEEIISITKLGSFYKLDSSKGVAYSCKVVVIAAPLDESLIHFDPPISIPSRKLQHTHATFVHGTINPAYFGLHNVWEIPELVGTIEDPYLPFSSISVLKRHNEIASTYKIFSRGAMPDTLLDQIFRERKETAQINWGAYPRYGAPEVFAEYVLDGENLYYINAFENAASTIETSVVAADNVARLIMSRSFNQADS